MQGPAGILNQTPPGEKLCQEIHSFKIKIACIAVAWPLKHASWIRHALLDKDSGKTSQLQDKERIYSCGMTAKTCIMDKTCTP